MLQLDENKGMIMQMELLALDNNFVLIAGYEDGSVLLWDVEKRSVLYSIKLFDDPIMALCFDYFTMKLLATSATNNIKVIKVEENFTKMELLQSIDTQYKGSSAVKLRNDNKLVFIGGWDGKVRIYNWKNMKLLAVLKYHSETINCLAFDENNKAIVGSKDGKISIWDVYT
ncbi:guanine nucleotide-binding protein subunit beta-like protein 1 [Clytia hemisphaerica]|uniref:guanine nucleotide-binding protein subunit beta-like protein 1 n=1 Tax=Clytia hemisphaerica TaxID=252671 RepID=UPI0034D6D02F